MSLNFHENTVHSQNSRWLIQLWPFWLLLIILGITIKAAFAYWPEIVYQSAQWQKQMHLQLTQLLQQVERHPQQAGGPLLLFSLVYGILHAVGPGHGKIIITTYLATHRSRLQSSLLLTLTASLLQGLVAIVLVTMMLVVWQLSSRSLHQGEFWLEKGSYMLLALLGCMICWRALKLLWQVISRWRRPQAPPSLVIRSAVPLPAHHVHHDQCGCGHRHLPDDGELSAANDWRTRLGVVLSMGIRPCSGAILVLLFSKVIGVYWWGVMSALVMAAGTSITLLALALIVYYCRGLAASMAKPHTPPLWRSIAAGCLVLAGGLMLAGAGTVMYISLQPTLGGSIGPFGR
ncbi:nickel/cobalt transporter [Biostraticola tofi]|uniref:Nickel/cobalt efflux system n=1 Tax=Biostraticola tofi TaxID=466109 RepID=A0A4R3YN02_9GAMM|nr:nickel/cobalt transporter [Biostraticola tofi]TCV92223.1 ABC-type nickel/cobalt efflux system permease component RcnA [Biostraticola tofi]